MNSYCKEKMGDEALALFGKMDEMGFASNYFAFNNLMSLYMRSGQPEKVSVLIEEMRKREIPLNKFGYNVLMETYLRLNNIEGRR